MNTRPDARIWRAAQQFFKAGEILWEHDDQFKCIFPLIMNYAFSCELSLKATEALVKQSNKRPDTLLNVTYSKSKVQGHKLHVIFNKLHKDTQDGIKAKFFLITGQQLIPLLEKCSKYFVEVRYGFEIVGGSYAVSDLRILAEGLLESVRIWGVDEEN